MVLRRIILICLFFIAALAVAAGSSYFPEFYHLYLPEIGHWATYDITGKSGTETLTFALVSKDGKNDWFEMRSKTGEGLFTVAYLVKGDPTIDSNVLKIKARSPDGTLIEIDKDTLERLRRERQSVLGQNAVPIGPTIGKLKSLPSETLKIKGHLLRCSHIKIIGKDGDSAEAWISREVPPFGLVKLVSGDDKVVLKDFGKGAKPTLTGPVKKLVVD